MRISEKNKFEKEGRVWLRKSISENNLATLDKVAKLHNTAGQRIKSNEQLMLQALSPESSIMRAIGTIDSKAKPVRIVAFNKSKENNWGVPWHQDRVIAVSEKHEVDGFKNWTKKSNSWHCEPPKKILDQMLFVRIHLDDTDDLNGAMKSQ